jgi:hypothetical protein
MGSRSTTRCSPSSCTSRTGTSLRSASALVVASATGSLCGGDAIGRWSNYLRNRNRIEPELGPRVACRRSLLPVEGFPVGVRLDLDRPGQRRPGQRRLPRVLDPCARETLLEVLDPLQSGVPVTRGSCRRRRPAGSTFGHVALHNVSLLTARPGALSNTAQCRASEPRDLCLGDDVCLGDAVTGYLDAVTNHLDAVTSHLNN